MERHLSALDIQKIKRIGRKIVMVTAYDYTSARLADSAGVDIILVGDSASMVMMGMKDTRYLTLEEMIVFCKSAARGVKHAIVVGDMPFMSYQVSVEEAVRNAGKLVKEGLVDAVKIEGGTEYADTVRAIVRAGIPVMGHIGLTPQSASMESGYRLRGKRAEEAKSIIQDALQLESAGAFAIVLEYTTCEVGKILSERLSIPVIGIGSGPYCDGQVLVFHDIVGLYEEPPPFSKKYIDAASLIKDALIRYREEVLTNRFPSESQYWNMDPIEYSRLLELISK
ncbi:MAG: 3-methyl-2-oxobutanoate hydroxymethyltransferase [Nitrososphaerota archaeon]